MKTFIILPVVIFSLYSCSKNTEGRQVFDNKGAVKIRFNNMVGSDSLQIGSTYMNFNGDEFTVSEFNYYISNIVLIDKNDQEVAEQESYHLLKASDPSSLSFIIPNVLVNEYKAIRFTIGVDSTRNVSGAQTGALDPVHNMFWSWSTGYIFTKLEGTSPSSPTGNIAFHIAGFYGPNNTIRTVILNFPSNAHVKTTSTPEIQIKTDVAEWFMAPSTVKFAVTYNVTTAGTLAKSIADNYADAFSVSQVEN